jgi:hypothetical protein
MTGEQGGNGALLWHIFPFLSASATTTKGRTCCRCVQVPVHVMAAVLSSTQCQRWESLVLQRTLDKMTDAFYCPRCQAVVLSEEDHCARCTRSVPGGSPTQPYAALCSGRCMDYAGSRSCPVGRCLFVFCSKCDDPWHPGARPAYRSQCGRVLV